MSFTNGRLQYRMDMMRAGLAWRSAAAACIQVLFVTITGYCVRTWGLQYLHFPTSLSLVLLLASDFIDLDFRCAGASKTRRGNRMAMEGRGGILHPHLSLCRLDLLRSTEHAGWMDGWIRKWGDIYSLSLLFSAPDRHGKLACI